MARYCWKGLNTFQVGKYAEYFFKMELTMYGLQVYQVEVDDHGIDFIAKSDQGIFIEIQVKSLRRPRSSYVFMHKEKFKLREHLYLALVLFRDEYPPELYLIPSLDWEKKKNESLFADRNYDGKKSKPEWGLNVSKNNMPLLQEYGFDKVINTLL